MTKNYVFFLLSIIFYCRTMDKPGPTEKRALLSHSQSFSTPQVEKLGKDCQESSCTADETIQELKKKLSDHVEGYAPGGNTIQDLLKKTAGLGKESVSFEKIKSHAKKIPWLKYLLCCGCCNDC